MLSDRNKCVELLEELVHCNWCTTIRVETITAVPVMVVVLIIRDNYITGNGGNRYVASGEAVCNENDRFDYVTGWKIALRRAARKIADIPGARDFIVKEYSRILY